MAAVAPRSLLLCPPTLSSTLTSVSRGPDVVVIDLEGVECATARGSVEREMFRLSQVGYTSVSPLYLRVNPADSSWHTRDLEFLHAGGFAGVVLPQWESVEALRALDSALASVEAMQPSGKRPLAVVLIVESASGMRECVSRVGRPHLSRTVSLAFGANDYCRDLGIDYSLASVELRRARQQLVTAARAWGARAYDSGCPGRPLSWVRREALQARSVGFTGKFCVAIEQVPVVNLVFSAGRLGEESPKGGCRE